MVYYRKCNTCGHVWYYTDQDLQKNKFNRVMNAFSAIGQMSAGLSGNVFQMTAANVNSQNIQNSNPIVDHNKCSQCNSTNVSVITGEEWERLRKQPQGEVAPVQTKVVQINTNATPESLVLRGLDFLEDEDWVSADAYADACLDLEPHNAEAFLVKMMAELKVATKEKLGECANSFGDHPLYQKIQRYGSDALKQEMEECLSAIETRNYQRQLEQAYNNAARMMQKAETPEAFLVAAKAFASFSEYLDAAQRAKQCEEKAEECRKNGIYSYAVSLMNRGDVEGCKVALEQFNTIADWRDSTQQAELCRKKIKHLRRKKKRTTITLVAVVAILAAVAVILVILRPNIKYNSAVKKVDSGDYVGAYEIFSTLDYKDSDEQAAAIYAKAMAQTISRANVGETVTFGRYEGDNISWIVIEKNGDQATLISEKCLTRMAYHNKKETVVWADSSMRKWLNDAFLNHAFTEEERQYLVAKTLQQESSPRYGTSGGAATTDMVYLLSISEARTLQISQRSIDKMYWLRSPITHETSTWKGTIYEYWYGAVVSHDGEIKEGVAGGDLNGLGYDCGVRPVICVEYH